MKKYQIKTPRFVLTKMTAEDGEKYYRLSNNPNVMKYVTGYALSREESDLMLSDIVADNEAGLCLGRYFVETRGEGKLVGAAKLDRVAGEVEIGYRIQEEHWGKGVATEIAVGLTQFAKRKLKAKEVVAYVNISNSASIRVLEKAGLQRVETIEDLDEIKHKFSLSITDSNIVKVLYILLGIIAVVFIAALTMPKDYALLKRHIVELTER